MELPHVWKKFDGGIGMTYQEDFILDKKYLNLIHKSVYSVELDMFGMITEIAVTHNGMYLKAYFDKVNDDRMIFFEDFKNGKAKFVVITDMDLPKKMEYEYKRETLENIKDFLGDDFSEDKVIYQTNDEHNEEIKRKDKLEVLQIGNTLLNLTKLSADIFYDNYIALELYKKYAEGVITEEELLYGVCNHLCEETKRLKDDNLNYFIEKYNNEQAEFLLEYISRELDVKKKGKKIIANKEQIFSIFDKLFGKDEKE